MLGIVNFSAAVVIHMNNDLNESQIGQLYQTQRQYGTRCAVLPKVGGKWSNMKKPLISLY